MTSLLVVVLVVFGVSSAQQPPRDLRPRSDAGATATLGGRVIVMDSKPAVPVRRARVSVTAPHLRHPEVTDTDVEGRYKFTNLAPGTYRVTVSKPGFVTLEAGTTRAGERFTIDVTDGAQASADVALPRGAAIDGRVVNEDGEPLQNVIVAAVTFVKGARGMRSITVRQSRSDDLGRYRIHSLPEGDYFVEASPDPRQVSFIAVAARDRLPGAARTYFPGTVQAHEARAIKLRRGQQITGTDFALSSVPVSRVGGRVFDSSGAVARNFGFRLHPVDAPVASVSGTSSAEGRFDFPAVPAGEYWVMATVVSAPGAVAEFAATRMRLGGEDMPEMTVSTAPGLVLRGRIEAETGVLPSLQGLSVTSIPMEFDLPAARPPIPEVTPAADGSFLVNGIFGPRLIRLSGLPRGWALKQVFLDDEDITDTPRDFRGANAARALRLLLTNATATIKGSVTDGGKAVRGCRVLLFPEAERLWTEGSRFIAIATALPSGFTFSGVLPGKYHVAAVDRFPDDAAAYDPDVLRRLRASATPVTVEGPGEQILKLELQVIR